MSVVSLSCATGEQITPPGLDMSYFYGEGGVPEGSSGSGLGPATGTGGTGIGTGGTSSSGSGTGGTGVAPPVASFTGNGDGLTTGLTVSAGEYILYDPSNLPKSTPAPVVIAFHKIGMTNAEMLATTEFDAKADAEGFVVILPNNQPAQWNVGGRSTFCASRLLNPGHDGTGFVTQVLNATAETRAIDRDKVFVTGLALGAYAASHIACQMPDVIAAVASHSGGGPAESCNGPVPSMVLHGDDDGTIRYEACGVSSYNRWADHNGCSSDSTSAEVAPSGSCETRTGCTATTTFCSFPGMDHGWAGSPEMSGYAKATDLVWDFFKAAM